MSDIPKTSPPLEVEVARNIQPQTRDVIANGLREFNRRYLGNFEWHNLDVYVRNANG